MTGCDTAAPPGAPNEAASNALRVSAPFTDPPGPPVKNIDELFAEVAELVPGFGGMYFEGEEIVALQLKKTY